MRSFLDPTRPGTLVAGRHVSTSYPVKAVAVLPKQAVVTVAGKGMVGVPGIAARTFAAVDAERLSVSTIFQGSSESSIGFTLPEAEAERAVASLRRAFRDEIAGGLIDGVTAKPDMSVIAVVGDGMAGTPGIAARVFTALETSAINVVAIAQGSSERNISFVVAGADAALAARKVHSAFQLAKIGGGRPPARPSTDVVLLGFGRVGRALATLIATSPAKHRVRIVGLLDRSGYVFDARGLRGEAAALAGREEGCRRAADRTRRQTGWCARGARLHVEPRRVASGAGGRHERRDEPDPPCRPASAASTSCWRTSGRWPVRGSPTRDCSRRRHPPVARVRFEATVGAGLPVIDTHKKLVETGDQVMRVDGCVSGTLMFVLSEVCGGRPFSEAVKDAVGRGYAEPDPRDDLSGQDAARKGLILARLLGYRGAAPVPENLVPAGLPAPAARHLHGAAAGTRRRLDAPGRARGRTRPCVALCGERHAKAGLRPAGLGARHEPARLGRRRQEPHHVHIGALQRRAAGRERPGRRPGGDRGGHPERHHRARRPRSSRRLGRLSAVLVNCVVYDRGERLADIPVSAIAEHLTRPECFVWIALKDPDPAELETLQNEFGLHELAVEDARHGHQRPKLDEYGASLFVVLRMVEWPGDDLQTGEVAIFVGPQYIISVRRDAQHGFTEVRRRCEQEPELLRHGPAYVLYALMDTVVDRYFPVLDRITEEIEAIEERIFASDTSRAQIEALYTLKRKLLVLDHATGPLLEVAGKLHGGRVPPVCAGLPDYFRDVYDHLLRLKQSIDNLRDMVTTAASLNLSLITISESEVTKRLAAYAALVAVPTMVAGIYGMNFTHMPELDWRVGLSASPSARWWWSMLYLVYRFRKARWM